MAEAGHVAEPRNFEPKEPVQLDPPKDDPISTAELAKCDGRFVLLLGFVLGLVRRAGVSGDGKGARECVRERSGRWRWRLPW